MKAHPHDGLPGVKCLCGQILNVWNQTGVCVQCQHFANPDAPAWCLCEGCERRRTTSAKPDGA